MPRGIVGKSDKVQSAFSRYISKHSFPRKWIWLRSFYELIWIILLALGYGLLVWPVPLMPSWRHPLFKLLGVHPFILLSRVLGDLGLGEFWKTLVSPSSGSYRTFPVFSWLFSGPFLWRQRLEERRPSWGGFSKWVLEALFWPLLVLVWHFRSWRDLAWHNKFWPETCNLQFAPAHRRPVS